MADSVVPRQYQILADWQPGQEYQLQNRLVGYQGYLRTLYQQGGKPVESEDFGRLRYAVSEYRRGRTSCRGAIAEQQ